MTGEPATTTTECLILMRAPGHDTYWQDAGTISASSAETAVRRWAEQQGDEFVGATVRCIPSRNAREFKPTARRSIDLA